MIVKYITLFLCLAASFAFSAEKNIPSFDTDIYPPDWKDSILYLSKDFPQTINIYLKGNGIAKPEEMNILLDLPAHIKLLDVPPFINCDGKYSEVKKYSADGTDFVQYRIPLNKNGINRICNAKKYFNTHIFVLLKSEKEGTATIKWAIEADRSIAKSRDMEIKTLPPLPPGNPPEKLVTYFCGGYYINAIKNEELMKNEIIPALKNAGLNHVYSPSREFIDLFQLGGLKCVGSGGHTKGRDCPSTYIMNNGKDDKTFNVIKNGSQVAMIVDHEPRSNCCFCDKCIQAFKEKMNVKREGLNKDIIQKEMPEQWAAFRAWQNGLIMKMWHEKINEAGKRFFLCSGIGAEGVLSDNHAKKYYLENGIDYHEYDRKCDVLSPMMYNSSRSVLEISEALNREMTVPVVPLVLVLNVPEDYNSMGADSAGELRLRLLAGAIGGGGGVGLWPGVGLNGETWHAVAKANHEIAKLEDYIGSVPEYNKDEVEIEGMPLTTKKIELEGRSLSYDFPKWRNSLVPRILKNGRKTLVTVFNFGNDDIFFKLKLKSLKKGSYRLYGPLGNEYLVAADGSRELSDEQLADGVALHIGPLDAMFWSLEDAGSPVVNSWKPQSEKETLNLYEKAKREVKKNTLKEEKAQGNCKIYWDDCNNDNIPELVLENPSEKIWISPDSGGRIRKWLVKKENRDLVIWNDKHGGLGVDLFWVPQNLRWCGEEVMPYEITGTSIDSTGVELAMKRSFRNDRLKNLCLKKNIRIPLDSDGISFSYIIENNRNIPVEISFWSKHAVNIGGLKDSVVELPLNDGALKLFSGPDAVKELVAGRQGCVKNEGFGKDNGFSGEWAVTRNTGSGTVVKAVFPNKDIFQFYSWRSEESTFEFMFEPVTINPGRSWQTRFDFFCQKK